MRTFLGVLATVALVAITSLVADADQKVNAVNAECEQHLEELSAAFRKAKADLGIN